MVTIQRDKTENLSMAGGIYTVMRKRLVEAESVIEIYSSGVLPKYGDRHPSLSRFRLSDFSCTEIGNLNNKIQVLWEGTYTSRAADFNDKDPWELDAHDFNAQSFSVTESMDGYYALIDGQLEFIRGAVKNTAGNAFEITHDAGGSEYNFVFCQKAKGQKEPNRNTAPLLNNATVKVAGITFEPYTGLLKPIQCRLVNDTDRAGNERSYYECSVTIQHLPKGWMKYAENVGTLARFKKNGKLTEPMPIYRYYKWTSKDKLTNLQTAPSYGCITDVYEARNKYANVMYPGKETSAEYWNAWQELPYEEVREPMYLAEDGTLDLEALKDGSKGLRVPYFDVSPASWKQFDLPSKKEIN